MLVVLGVVTWLRRTHYAQATGWLTRLQSASPLVTGVTGLVFAVANRPEIVSLAGGMPNIKDLPLDGIAEHLAEIDGLLAEHSHNWRVERMSSVDRNILRIAVYEMLHGTDTPVQVAINEALEVAKRYSIDESVPFINGILDAVQSRTAT